MTPVQVVTGNNGYQVCLVMDLYELSSEDLSASQEITPDEADQIAVSLMEMARRARELSV